jgi:sensor c-di-GMP phosphodiesterase-like protein
MGLVLRALTRRNLVAIFVGVLLAGAPLLALDFWLDGLIERQGQAEITTAARRAVALANSRLQVVIEALDNLAAQGVNSCRPDAIVAMRQTAFSAMPIKEVAVVGPDGQTQCTHLGLPLG